MTKKIKEIIRFIISGGLCFAIELVILILLHDKLRLDTLLATPIAFLISVVANYLMCVLWVFSGAREQNNIAKLGFFITSAVGLFLNEGLMFLFRVIFGEDHVILNIFHFTITMYMINKVLATLIVMFWNYITKKKILNQGNKKQQDDPEVEKE